MSAKNVGEGIAACKTQSPQFRNLQPVAEKCPGGRELKNAGSKLGAERPE
jgi:hypothetical protein